MAGAGVVVVVGAGVAGMSAAIELAERGVNVTLLESADRVGGKARGWRDAQGNSLEHGLHGWWLEYTNFRDLLRRVGIEKNLTVPVGPFTVIHRDGTIDRLTFSPSLPSPFHALGMFHGVRSLGVREKLSSIRAGLAVAAFDPDRDYYELDRFDFHTWLDRKGVAQRAAAVLFDTTLRSNLFLPMEQTSAASGINALLRGMRRRDSWRFSWLRGNTGDYLWTPLADYFISHGGQLRLHTRATGLQLTGDRLTAVMASENGGPPTPLPADAAILAVDIESCKALVSASLNAVPYFNRLFNLTTTDVLVTRTWFQGDIPLQHTDGMLVGFRIVDAFLDVTRLQHEPSQPGITVVETQSYLGKPWMKASDATIQQLVVEDLADAFPQLENAHLANCVVLRHPALFTAFGIGFETYRPQTRTPLRNLFMAGDWVRAPEPVMFMENAVITGRRAASAVLESQGMTAVPIVPLPPADLPISVLQALGRVAKTMGGGIRRVVGFQPIGSTYGA